MALISVVGRHPLHRVASTYPLVTRCGVPVVAHEARRAQIRSGRRDLCRACFPAPARVIRLGRNQRVLVRRALASRALCVYPIGRRGSTARAGKAEAEATAALLRRGILVRAPGLPGAYRIASPELAIHLKGTLLQHPKG